MAANNRVHLPILTLVPASTSNQKLQHAPPHFFNMDITIVNSDNQSHMVNVVGYTECDRTLIRDGDRSHGRALLYEASTIRSSEERRMEMVETAEAVIFKKNQILEEYKAKIQRVCKQLRQSVAKPARAAVANNNSDDVHRGDGAPRPHV